MRSAAGTGNCGNSQPDPSGLRASLRGLSQKALHSTRKNSEHSPNSSLWPFRRPRVCSYRLKCFEGVLDPLGEAAQCGQSTGTATRLLLLASGCASAEAFRSCDYCSVTALLENTSTLSRGEGCCVYVWDTLHLARGRCRKAGASRTSSPRMSASWTGPWRSRCAPLRIHFK